jgi:hypothetical protein
VAKAEKRIQKNSIDQLRSSCLYQIAYRSAWGAGAAEVSNPRQIKRCAGCPTHQILDCDCTYVNRSGINNTCRPERRRRSTSIGVQRRRSSHNLGHNRDPSRDREPSLHHGPSLRHGPSRRHGRRGLAPAKSSHLPEWQTCWSRRRTTKRALRDSASGYCSVWPF